MKKPFTLTFLLFFALGISSSMLFASTIETNCGAFKIPTVAGNYIADSECVDGTWTHYYQSGAEDILLLSIQKDAQVEITPSDVKVGLQGDGNIFDLTNLPYTVRNVPWLVMSRHWEVNPSVQPSEELKVRIYYSQNDFESIQEAVNEEGGSMLDDSELIFFKFESNSGINPDPSLPQPHVGATRDNFVELEHFSGSLTNEFRFGEFSVSSFSGGGIGGSTIQKILPIELVEFEVQEVDNRVELNWTTASETDNEYFYIMRSIDGFNFVNVGRVEGGGTVSEPRQYVTTDPRPSLGLNYYRLKQVDFDGNEVLSEVKVVKFKGNRFIDIIPTLAISNARIELPEPYTVDARLSVFDMFGREVLRTTMPAEEYFVYLDLSNLSVGNYLVKVTDGYIFLSKRFCKIH